MIRANRNENYTVMSNVHLKDKRMTLKAKGLLSVVLSLPPDWDYSFAGLVAICKESETAMKSAIKELKEFGYLTITKERDEKGHFDYVYVFNENPPTDLPVVENPVVENPPTDNPMVENVRQLNTNKSNTKELNTKDKKENTKRKSNIPYQQIVDMYNDTCVSFPCVKTLSESRKKAIKARLNTYSIDDFRTLFEKAESSDFLKGKNNRDWSATFDWLIKDSNMAKVLDGNYDSKAERELDKQREKEKEEEAEREKEEREEREFFERLLASGELDGL